MESIDDVLIKRFGKPLVFFMKIVDPDRKYSIGKSLGDAWDSLTLQQQRRLYLYLLYRKWRGIDIYGEPYYIIMNCHPVPFNWNGNGLINRLMRETPMVRAKHNGDFGIYTRDEALVWQMTDIVPLNFRNQLC